MMEIPDDERISTIPATVLAQHRSLTDAQTNKETARRQHSLRYTITHNIVR